MNFASESVESAAVLSGNPYFTRHLYKFKSLILKYWHVFDTLHNHFSSFLEDNFSFFA